MSPAPVLWWRVKGVPCAGADESKGETKRAKTTGSGVGKPQKSNPYIHARMSEGERARRMEGAEKRDGPT